MSRAAGFRLAVAVWLWGAAVGHLDTNDVQFVQISGVPALSGVLVRAEPASFGPQFSESSLRDLRLVRASPADLCSWPPDNLDELAGAAVMVARGGCTFVEKVLNAEDAGAAAMLVYALEPGPPLYMGTGPADDATEVSIPSAFIAKEDADKVMDCYFVACYDNPQPGDLRLTLAPPLRTSNQGLRQPLFDVQLHSTSIPPSLTARQLTMTSATGQLLRCQLSELPRPANAHEHSLRLLEGGCLYREQDKKLWELCHQRTLRILDCSADPASCASARQAAGRPDRSAPGWKLVGLYNHSGAGLAVSAFRSYSHQYDSGERCSEVVPAGSCDGLFKVPVAPPPVMTSFWAGLELAVLQLAPPPAGLDLKAVLSSSLAELERWPVLETVLFQLQGSDQFGLFGSEVHLLMPDVQAGVSQGLVKLQRELRRLLEEIKKAQLPHKLRQEKEARFCSQFNHDSACQRERAHCVWLPASRLAARRELNKTSATVWFRCAEGGLHELTEVNQTSDCLFQAAVDTPLACREQDGIRLWPAAAGSMRWQCTPAEANGPGWTPVLDGQWLASGTGPHGEYSVTMSMAPMRGQQEHYALLWSLAPPVAHPVWGLGVVMDGMMLASMGAGLVVYKLTGAGGLDGRWVDGTGIRRSRELGTPIVADKTKRLFWVTGLPTIVSDVREVHEHRGLLRVSPANAQPNTVLRGAGSACDFMNCKMELLELKWSFEDSAAPVANQSAPEAPSEPDKWQQHGLGLRWGKWLVAGWASVQDQVGIAAYAQGRQMSGFYAVREPGEQQSPLVVYRERLVRS